MEINEIEAINQGLMEYPAACQALGIDVSPRLMCGHHAEVGMWVGWGKPASDCAAVGQFKFVGCILAITNAYVVIFVMPVTLQHEEGTTHIREYMEYDISRAFVQSYFVGELSHTVMVPSPVDGTVSPSRRHEETAEVFREWCEQNVRMDGTEAQT